MSTSLSRDRAKGRPLSDLELKVALLCAKDLANKQIAYELGIPQRSVEDHVYSAVRKLGVRSKIGVALWAAKNA